LAIVVWTDRALADVEAAAAWVARHSPLAAQRLARRLIEAGDGLEQFPMRGRDIGRGRRELPLVWPFVIRYRVHNDRVDILEVWHGARDRADTI
jgi:toxin ParE1/3/4